jgi:hypothetical protein
MTRLAILAALAATPAAPADVIPAEQFAALHRLIRPQPDEARWASVPWLTDLDAARRRAAADDRPLLVWRAGGGQVLGRA